MDNRNIYVKHVNIVTSLGVYKIKFPKYIKLVCDIQS